MVSVMPIREHGVATSQNAPESAAGDNLPELHRAILLTVLCSDLFDYPLTDKELYRYLVVACPEYTDFDRALAGLMGRHLARTENLITLPGREHLVEVRRQRQLAVEQGWVQAGRYARWLAFVPFVRMVAVCGSQAAGNASPDSDVDFFLVTAPRRLWTVQVCSMLLRPRSPCSTPCWPSSFRQR